MIPSNNPRGLAWVAAAIVATDTLWELLMPQRGLSVTIVRLAVEGCVGLAAFLLVALLLRMEELAQLWQIIVRRPRT